MQATDDFVRALAAAMCDWQFRCCSLPEVDAIGGSSYVNVSECRPIMELALGTWFGESRAAAAAGRVTVDPALAQACVDTFSGGPCSPASLPQDPWQLFYQCLDPFVGQVPIGAPCHLRDECAAGSRCVPGLQMTDMVAMTPEGVSALPTVQFASGPSGACLAYVEAGERCRATADCAPGLYCRADDFVCAHPAAVGEACEPPTMYGFATHPCDDTRKPLVCLGTVCGRLPRAGEPCLATGGAGPACDPDPALALACVGARFNGPGICEPRGKRGAACGGDGLPPCELGLACVPGDGSSEIGSCGPAPAVGESCAGSGGVCAGGATCDSTSEVCVQGKRGRDGASCQTGGDCLSGTCYQTDVDAGTCQPSGVINMINCNGEGAPGTASPADPDAGAAGD